MNDLYNLQKRSKITKISKSYHKKYDYVPILVNKINFEKNDDRPINSFKGSNDNTNISCIFKNKSDSFNRKSFYANKTKSTLFNFDPYFSSNFYAHLSGPDVPTQNSFYKPSTAGFNPSRPKEKLKKGQNQLIYERLLAKINFKNNEKKTNRCITILI